MKNSAFLFMLLLLASCASLSDDASKGENHSRTLQGDSTGALYRERDGVVQNLNTGEIGYRRGAWIQDAKTGEMIFTYGNVVEEKRHK